MNAAHTQAAPGQKMPLHSALSPPLIHAGKTSCNYSLKKNPDRSSSLFLRCQAVLHWGRETQRERNRERGERERQREDHYI